MAERDSLAASEFTANVMRELSDKNFGIAIAYLIPGFVVLWGASYLSGTVNGWLRIGDSAGSEPTIGSFLYVLLGSLAAGLVVSALRWATVDTLHHATGVAPPSLNFSALHDQLESFVLIVEANYRFYQFYSNTAVAILIAAACQLNASGSIGGTRVWIVGILVEVVLLAGSRDALKRYYDRTRALLGETDRESSDRSFD